MHVLFTTRILAHHSRFCIQGIHAVLKTASQCASQEAAERLQRYGPNELQDGEGVSWVRVLVSQIGMVVCCFRGIALTDILI